MNTFRQLLTVLLIPLYLFVGAVIAQWVSKDIGIWDMYVGAVVLPLIGLLGTYFVAPYFRIYNLVFIYLIGLILAYLWGYPAQYPEGSEHPYHWTYRPFALTFIWSTILLAGGIVLVSRKNL